MTKTLTQVGNSKALIIPKRLIRKYNLTEVTIIETEEGILISSAAKEPSFQERLEQLKKDKKRVYAQMKKEASLQEVQHYYENSELEDVDIDIVEE